MTRIFAFTLAALALIAGAFSVTAPAQASDGIAGEYFAVGGCFQSKSAARNPPGGWVQKWCAVEGPYIRSEATVARNDFRRRGVGDAYLKSGW
jgi:hypothetical protein